jgi:hypothetical protein
MALLKSVGKKLAEKATEGALASVSKQARAIGKKSDVIPPPFERAPAKTKEEIDAIARRVAPQLTGEFVRLDPTKSINPAGLSKKRFDIEKELEHDIRPVREVAPPSMFDYESNLGKVQLGVFGDPTISQQDIYSIAGRKLPTPSRQYGGPRYPMYEPEDAWASNFGAASGLQSSAERASKQYGGADVVGLYTKMGKDSYDFAQHLSDALMKNIMISLPDMNKKQIAGFNKMVRNNPDAKDFAGIENPDIALAQMEKNPEMRKQFSMLATTPTYTKAFNMPNGLDVVNAVLEPDLRNLERGMTGYTTIELDPNVTHLHATDRASTTTYDTRIPRKEGAEVQQLEALAPYDLQYPDQLLAISKNPKQAPQPFGTLMMSGARQIIDPQHIDEIGLYRDFIKKYTGKKKGGSVEKDPEQIRDMIKGILGSDVEKAEGGTVADDAEEYGQQLKEQRKTLGSDILKSGAKGITEGVGNILRSAKETLSRAGTLGDIAKIPVDPLLGKMQYEAVTGKKFPELKPISLLPEQSITESPVGAKILPFTTEGQQFAGEVLGDPLSYSVSGAGRGIKKIGQFVGKGLAEQVQTGRGIIGRNIVNPRANILPERGVNLGVDFFRPSEDTIRGHKMDAIPGSQWYSWLQSNAPKSSKKELEASGTMNWLKDSQEKISKNDIINHLRENEPNLRSKTYSSYETHPYEVIGDAESGNYDVVDSSMGDTVISSHGDQGDAYMAMDELANEMYPMTKYKQYTLPGGEEYREIVIQDKPKVWSKNKKFESSHYPEATNPIAHLRVNHRDDADGNPTLFIEELQSDWGQKGKKEGFGQKQLPTDMSAEDLLNNYRDNLSYSQKAWLNRFIGQWESIDAYNNVPNQAQKLDELTDLYQNWVKSQEFGVSRNPYVEDTKDWTALALKQAIKEAVDNGKTQVAWTTGIQQAERYDLSKRLSSVSLHPREDGQFTLNAYDHDGRRAIQELVTENNLDEYIGKDLANKLLAVKTHTEKPFTQAEHRLLDHYMEVGKKNLSQDEIKDFDRLMDQANKNKEANIRRLDGLDIKTEHKGMQGYYDNILPQVANDVIKQLGGKNKVKTIRVKQGDATYALRNKTTGYDVGGGYSYEEAKQAIKENPNREMYKVSGGDSDQLGFEITPDMIKFIKEDAGIPKFKKGGSIDLQQEYKLENMRRRYG